MAKKEKKGYGARYDIYNSKAPKTPEAAKEIANKVVELHAKVRKSFLGPITTMANQIANDAQSFLSPRVPARPAFSHWYGGLPGTCAENYRKTSAQFEPGGWSRTPDCVALSLHSQLGPCQLTLSVEGALKKSDTLVAPLRA